MQATTATGRQAAVEPEVSWLKVHIAARRYGRLPQRRNADDEGAGALYPRFY